MRQANNTLIALNTMKKYKQFEYANIKGFKIIDENLINVKLISPKANIIEYTFGNNFIIQTPERYTDTDSIFVDESAEELILIN